MSKGGSALGRAPTLRDILSSKPLGCVLFMSCSASTIRILHIALV